ncbi:MAG: sulfate ABC transporter permease [Acetobacter sp.]|nr:sulfate ABC transporter permease [Acetobacter sp.]MBQ5470061.1 sulfate ABC transporter permease [Acetobacter sp.]
MIRYLIWIMSWLFIFVVLILPLILVITEALRSGFLASVKTLCTPDAVAAIWLTIRVTIVAIIINTFFGILAAWLLSRFRFVGRQTLLILVELPLSISPVVSGLLWLLLFGDQGWFGPLLERWNVHIAFATSGIILATLFVTLPYVVRTLIPVMEIQGRETEEVALLAGAGFWRILWNITLPLFPDALISGILLTTARALGEFGAVSVVSGHIPGETETMPLRIEDLYNGYQSVGAFTMATLLAIMAMITVLLRTAPDWACYLWKKDP